MGLITTRTEVLLKLLKEHTKNKKRIPYVQHVTHANDGSSISDKWDAPPHKCEGLVKPRNRVAMSFISLAKPGVLQTARSVRCDGTIT